MDKVSPPIFQSSARVRILCRDFPFWKLNIDVEQAERDL